MIDNSFTELTKQYAAWLDTLGFSSGIVYDYPRHVTEFFQWLELQRITRINALTQKHVSHYFNYLESRPNKRYKGRLLSVSHLNHNFAAVDKLLEFLHAQDLQNTPVPTNYRMKVDKDEQIRKIETLTKDQIKLLYNTITDTYSSFSFEHREKKHYQLKIILALYYGCGLRLSEGAKLRLQDIDFDRKTVFVEKGKNYKDRIVPMSAGVYRDLQDYVYNFRSRLKVPHKRLFLHKKDDLNKMLKHLQSTCNDAQIQQKRLSMHVLRHSIATHLLQNGMSIENISLFLGHSSLESTQIYTHLVQ